MHPTDELRVSRINRLSDSSALLDEGNLLRARTAASGEPLARCCPALKPLSEIGEHLASITDNGEALALQCVVTRNIHADHLHVRVAEDGARLGGEILQTSAERDDEISLVRDLLAGGLAEDSDRTRECWIAGEQ